MMVNMQNLDVISVNLWQILISLANLVLLFLILKKFLFKPVMNILEKRNSEIDESYENASKAEKEAEDSRAAWEDKLSGADAKAAEIVQNAADQAKYRADTIIADAENKAEGIVRMAKTEALLERKKAADGIKREIVEVSSALSEKLLEREINAEDHKKLIDSFIDDIGDAND